MVIALRLNSELHQFRKSEYFSKNLSSFYKFYESCKSYSNLNYIMPPMPPISGMPIPPPAFLSGMSATTASVVKNIAATDAAF